MWAFQGLSLLPFVEHTVVGHGGGDHERVWAQTESMRLEATGERDRAKKNKQKQELFAVLLLLICAKNVGKDDHQCGYGTGGDGDGVYS